MKKIILVIIIILLVSFIVTSVAICKNRIPEQEISITDGELYIDSDITRIKSVDADYIVTGIVSSKNRILIYNCGDRPICFIKEYEGIESIYRIHNGNKDCILNQKCIAYELQPEQCVEVVYDSYYQRWLVI